MDIPLYVHVYMLCVSCGDIVLVLCVLYEEPECKCDEMFTLNAADR